MPYSPSKYNLNPSNSGFTIIEVLIALAIFSIGLLAMSALQSSSLLATGNIGAQTEAWTVLEDQVERLKAMPFYANNNSIDDTLGGYSGSGTIDELTEEMPDLIADANLIPAGSTHSRLYLNGRYTVQWQVVNDQPIPPVVVPPPTATSPQLGSFVPAGTYTVSKTISVWVTRGNNIGAAIPPATADILASCQFVKTWAEAGQRPYR